MKKLPIAAALIVSALAVSGLATAFAADTTEVVDPASIGNGWYTADTRAPGSGQFEKGPATPPLGKGSFEMVTPDGASKVQLFTDQFDGVRLADIDGVGYSTYNETAGVAMAAINARIDKTGDGNPDSYLVYEPYQDEGNAALQQGAWQNWDAYKGGSAKWWVNNGVTDPNTSATICTQSVPCEWNTLVAAVPNATIEEGTVCGPGAAPKSPCPGSFGVNQGSGNAGGHSNADALYLSVSGDKTTFDFEPTSGPTCFGETPTIDRSGENGGVVVLGTPGDDIILTGNGDDTVNGLGGNDKICTVDGNDTVLGGAGDDQIFGGRGDDRIQGQAGNDALTGGDGNDEVQGGDGNDVVRGQDGDDVVQGGNGDDDVYGGRGNDVVTGGSGTDDCDGDAGSFGPQGTNDRLTATHGCETTVNFP